MVNAGAIATSPAAPTNRRCQHDAYISRLAKNPSSSRTAPNAITITPT
jgi:hypothetical protein